MRIQQLLKTLELDCVWDAARGEWTQSLGEGGNEHANEDAREDGDGNEKEV